MDYSSITDHYELTLAKNPTNPLLAVDWTDKEAAHKRYLYFVDFYLGSSDYYHVNFEDTLLDFGSGLAELYTYLPEVCREFYTGIDISPRMVSTAKENYPAGNFICQDILKTPIEKDYDYITCVGTFCEKRRLGYYEMVDFTLSCLKELWKHTNKGLALDVMDDNKISYNNQRPELFFMTYDQIVSHIIKELKPASWSIENIGLNDCFIKVYK